MGEKMKQAIKLLSFDNRIKDELATIVSYTDGFLWRRDLTRLVACRLANKQTGHTDFVVGDVLIKQHVKAIELNEKGELSIQTSAGEEVFEPVVQTRPDSLRYTLRKDQSFLEEYHVLVKPLKNILHICEQKWILEKVEEPKIIFDFQQGCIRMQNREEVFPIPFQEKKKTTQTKIIYNFHLLKDMMYNKQKEDIFFRISEQYTVFEYGEDVYGVLMHASL